MRVLGIDPGYAIVGWGVVEYISNRFAPIGYGAVITEKDTPFEQRLVEIYESVFDICKRYQPEALSIEKLEAMTAVCSVGLDMIIIPGDVTPAIISGIIADEAAIGMVNSKTTAVRVIPAVGRQEGDTLEFGGLLGHGPVMKVNRNSPEVFIRRGGHIPAPLQSLKN